MFLFETLVLPKNTNSSVLQFGETVGKDVADKLGAVNWIAPTWDLFIVIFFLVTVFLYGLSLGRDRIIVILVSIYMALAVISNAPLVDTGAEGESFAIRVTAFLAIFILLFFLLSRSALMNTFGTLAAGTWWQVFVFSTFHVGLLVSITLSFLPKDAIGHLAPITQQIFASETGRFFWIVAPIIGMSMLRGEK